MSAGSSDKTRGRIFYTQNGTENLVKKQVSEKIKVRQSY